MPHELPFIAALTHLAGGGAYFQAIKMSKVA